MPKHLSALKEIKEAEEFFNSGAFGTEAKELVRNFNQCLLTGNWKQIITCY